MTFKRIDINHDNGNVPEWKAKVLNIENKIDFSELKYVD